MKRLVSVACLLVVGLVATKLWLAPRAADSEEVVQSMRVDVRDTITSVITGLRERGIEVEDPTGSFAVCGMKDSALEFGASAVTSPESGSIPDQLAVAAEVIGALGIPMAGEREDSVSTDPAQSNIRVSAKASPQDPRSLIVEVARDCEELDTAVVDEWRNEHGDTLGYQG